MNIDSFKQSFIMATAQRGLDWSEIDYQGNGCRLMSVVALPNFPRCFITVDLEAESILINYYLNQAVYSTDTLKLVNDFNENVNYLKAYVAPYDDATYLMVSAGDFFISSEEDGINAFMKLFSYIQSQEVAMFLRPLTIISRQ